MRKTLPDHLIFPDGPRLPVRQAHIDKPETLGYLDKEKPEIVIKKDQPEAGKHIVLVHEIIHMAELLMIEEGIIKRRPSHEFVSNLAGILVATLVLSGLWAPPISKEEMLDLIEQENNEI
jgi:hypothetical protein